ncbi:helix-turn-helix domain-containing protein [Spirosoma areae]
MLNSVRPVGNKQAAIAQTFGLTQPWVSRTLKKYNQQGLTALQEGKRTGAPPVYRPNNWPS